MAANRYKRILFWLIFAAYAGMCAGICFLFRYDQGRLYRAVPPDAILISEHESLAARWDGIARSEPARALCRALAPGDEECAERLVSAGIKRMLGRLASRNSILAYVPSLGIGGKPAVIFASWIGVEGQFIRMGLYNAYLSDFRKTTLSSGRKVLVSRNSPAGGGRGLALVVSEGILIGCLSVDPMAVEEIVVRVEGGAPIVPALFDRLARPAGSPAARDRVWMPRIGASRYSGGVKLLLERCDAAGIEGVLRAPAVILEPWKYLPPTVESNSIVGRASRGEPVQEDLGRISSWLGDAPAAVLTVPLDALTALLEIPSADKNLAFVSEAVRKSASDDVPLLVGLCRAAYSGRILGFGSPTLVMSFKLKDPSSFEQDFSDVLDGLNARLGWGLIPNKTLVEGHQIVSVRGVRKGIYGKMGEGEHPAISVLDGWLVSSSNGKVLGDLIRESVNRPQDPAPRWADNEAYRPGGAMLWADIPEAAKSLARAVAVYDLMSYANNSRRSSGPFREGLGFALELMQNVETLRTMRAWMDSDGREIEIRFRFDS